MPKRVLIGTDIATIGIWDPAYERQDLKSARYTEFVAALREEAEAGRLFYIETGGDGSSYVDIYIDEVPDADLLSAYSPVEREFLVLSTSEALTAGGVEEFAGYVEVVTPSPNEFSLANGRYALTLYELDDDKLEERIASEIGEGDYHYYEQRWSGLPWGCLIFVIGIVILALQMWFFGAAVLAAWVLYISVRWRIHASDERFQEIAKRIDVYEDRFPPLLFCLRRLVDTEEVEGGWYVGY